ncbi:hypothetical protein ACP70R_036690 [Stipagrostis hirtigluma subsp. patula]
MSAPPSSGLATVPSIRAQNAHRRKCDERRVGIVFPDGSGDGDVGAPPESELLGRAEFFASPSSPVALLTSTEQTMGLGIDLEAAAEPYHALQADDPQHAAASGGRRRGFLVASAVVALFLALAIIDVFSLTRRAPSFTVDLTGYEGIDPARAGRVVSPAFNVTLRMNNTCVDSADVAVMYSGVALGWARVEPRDCAEGRWGRDVEVVARGGKVGLSRGLRDRMASDWRSGVLELDVDVKTYGEGRRADTEIPQRMIVYKVRITDKG